MNRPPSTLFKKLSLLTALVFANGAQPFDGPVLRRFRPSRHGGHIADAFQVIVNRCNPPTPPTQKLNVL